MGGCATKPKVSKDDAAHEAPEPAAEHMEELIMGEKKNDQETKTEAIVEEGKKEETETETKAAPVVEEGGTESNPPQESQLVVVEEKEATDEIVEQVIKEVKYTYFMFFFFFLVDSDHIFIKTIL